MLGHILSTRTLMGFGLAAGTALFLGACSDAPRTQAPASSDVDARQDQTDIPDNDAMPTDATEADSAAPDAVETVDAAPTDTPHTDMGSPDAGGPTVAPPTTEVDWLEQFHLLAQDAQGFSSLVPSTDSRIVYVSASSGNDASGGTYQAQSPEVGADPFNPSGAVSPFATLAAALEAVRSGYPDWVLLRRGDVWTVDGNIDAKSGRSPDERWLLSAYGPGTERPMIRTGTAPGIRFWRNVQFSATTGIHFYAHGRDPDGPDFAGFDNVGSPPGFYAWAEGETPTRTILVEDCFFEFYSNNVVQGPVSPRDIVVRRNIITRNYATSSHSQGMYSKGASILLEGNLFDHNGWYKQSYIDLNDQAEGQATYYNHNTYFTNTQQTIMRGNLFLRASSIGNKFTANPEGDTDEVMAQDVLIEDNFYAEGEVGISAGGNKDNGDGHRFKNFIIVHNVLTAIGRAQPTNRTLGWGVEVDDWDGGVVGGNVFTHIGDEVVQNIFAISLFGHSQGVDVSENTMVHLSANRFAIRIDGDPKSQLTIHNNAFQFDGTPMRFIDTEYTAAGTFFENIYATSATTDPFAVSGDNVGFSAWQQAVGDEGAQLESLSYVDSERTIESYTASLGFTPTLEAFIAEAKLQSRQYWRPALTASALNAYIRAGVSVP